MFQTKFLEKVKAHILCSTTFFFESHAIYEIMWENLVLPDITDDNIKWCTHSAYWISTATDTCSEYVIHVPFLWQ